MASNQIVHLKYKPVPKSRWIRTASLLNNLMDLRSKTTKKQISKRGGATDKVSASAKAALVRSKHSKVHKPSAAKFRRTARKQVDERLAPVVKEQKAEKRAAVRTTANRKPAAGSPGVQPGKVLPPAPVKQLPAKDVKAMAPKKTVTAVHKRKQVSPPKHHGTAVAVKKVRKIAKQTLAVAAGENVVGRNRHAPIKQAVKVPKKGNLPVSKEPAGEKKGAAPKPNAPAKKLAVHRPAAAPAKRRRPAPAGNKRPAAAAKKEAKAPRGKAKIPVPEANKKQIAPKRAANSFRANAKVKKTLAKVAKNRAVNRRK